MCISYRPLPGTCIVRGVSKYRFRGPRLVKGKFLLRDTRQWQFEKTISVYVYSFCVYAEIKFHVLDQISSSLYFI